MGATPYTLQVMGGWSEVVWYGLASGSVSLQYTGHVRACLVGSVMGVQTLGCVCVGGFCVCVAVCLQRTKPLYT